MVYSKHHSCIFEKFQTGKQGFQKKPFNDSLVTQLSELSLIYLIGLILVRATNSKLLGTKILEVSKNFRVELENT